MKYEIDLPGKSELADLVVDRVAADVLHGGEHRDGIRDQIGKSAVQLVANHIEAQVSSIVEKHLSTPFQPTNHLGEPVGEPLTLRARIAEQVTTWCETVVDSDGKLPSNDYYNSRSRDKKTRAEWAIHRAVEGIANDELKKAVDAAAKETKQQIFGKVKDVTAETIRRILGLP